MSQRLFGVLAALFAVAVATPAVAQEVGVNAEIAFVFNSFAFLFAGVLVMLMAAGFCMLEAGLVRSKNTATICLKNIAIYSLAGIAYYVIGYHLMYTGVEKLAEDGTPEALNGLIGSFQFLYNPADAEVALKALTGIEIDGESAETLAAGVTAVTEAISALSLEGITAPTGDITEEAANAYLAAATDAVVPVVADNGYASQSDWYFQMVFVAAAASIVSGTVAERLKLWPFLIFTTILTGIIYPIQGSWTWGGGFLADMGFSDFAGSTIVHSVGGWAALVGAILVGPRAGKYNKDGTMNPIPGANLPLATLGTFILWFGWFGFNGGSQLAIGSANDAASMSIVFANTNLAAAAGVVAAMLLSQILYGKVDLTMALNGALGGLVGITAGPDLDNHLLSMIIGAIAGVIVVITVPMLDKLKIDDVVGAIPVHLFCGIWGTLAVGIFGGGDLVTQIIGIVAIGLFVSITSAVVWLILKATVGLRASDEDQANGLDRVELGLEAYPEFRQTA